MKKLFLLVIIILPIYSMAQNSFFFGGGVGFTKNIPVYTAETGVMFNKNIVSFNVQQYTDDWHRGLKSFAKKAGIPVSELTPRQIERYNKYVDEHQRIEAVVQGKYSRILQLPYNFSLLPTITLGGYINPNKDNNIKFTSSLGAGVQVLLFKHVGLQFTSCIAVYQNNNLSTQQNWITGTNIVYYIFK